ncbi:MAG: hypothetical protein MZU97_08185 [Bacillus subtilis]|nr:hypothetical protein [Bacillus subtilis]
MTEAPRCFTLGLMNTRNAIRPAALFAALALFASVLGSCSRFSETVREVKRESLFSLGYGTLEDQLDLFRVEGMAPPAKTRIAMRDGIFFLANGNGAKVLTLSSFGDLLSMVYNPERNPPPVVLSQPGASSSGRAARPYPFLSPGEIAVDSRSTSTWRTACRRTGAPSTPGRTRPWSTSSCGFPRRAGSSTSWGRRASEGTPFPVITGVHVTAQDDCVVLSMTREAWLVYWFDSRGLLKSTVRIRRDSLPSRTSGTSFLPGAHFPRPGRGRHLPQNRLLRRIHRPGHQDAFRDTATTGPSCTGWIRVRQPIRTATRSCPSSPWAPGMRMPRHGSGSSWVPPGDGTFSSRPPTRKAEPSSPCTTGRRKP